MMNGVAVKCVGIRKGYGKGESRIEALKGIDVDIYKGKLTLLVGPSGCGKTTLLSIITTILTPDEGRVFLFGKDTKEMHVSERARFCRNNLGIVFQSLFLVPTLTVMENVSLPLIVSGHTHQEASEKSIEILKKMGLEHRLHDSPTVLSKGQQQRVAIARAMVHDSKLIVCDEPTSALDQTAGLEIMSLLQSLVQHSSCAVLVVTHDHRIFSFADRIIHMNDGQIVSGEKNE